MSALSGIINYASGLSSVVSTAALIATIYYYRKQTQLLQTQLEQLQGESSIQECLQVRDSIIRLHQVLTPLIGKEIEEMIEFRHRLNEECSTPLKCMVYVHNLFTKISDDEGGLSIFTERLSRLVRDLRSMKVKRFERFSELIDNMIESICDSDEGCKTLDDLEKLQLTFGKGDESQMKEIESPIIDDIEKDEIKEEYLREEVLGSQEDFFDVLDRLDFLVECKCGKRKCNEVFPISDLMEEKINPIKELIDDPDNFCKKYEVSINCKELVPMLKDIEPLAEKDSKRLYAMVYLNHLANEFRRIVNNIVFPSQVDLNIRLRAELERITCTKLED